MTRLASLFGTLAMFIALSIVAAPAASAWSPFGRVNCSGEAANSAVCADRNNTDDPIAGPDGIIMEVINIVAFAAGVAAIIIIILAGLRMITSGGSSEDIAGARRALIYAIVGLVVIVVARALISLIISML